MIRHSTLSASGAGLMALAALVGAAIALYAYFTPMTGVTGTPGALLVVVSSLALLAAGVILWLRSYGFVYWALIVLGFLGVAGTFAAGWFLHEWLLMAAMAVVAVGLVLALFRRSTSAVEGN
ncbi:hypothetical protein [Devosia sp.]|uniref:hypothetical protein n=1 Tax=Devosia sp. TaxID=1871048 RepID=UPI003A90F5CD